VKKGRIVGFGTVAVDIVVSVPHLPKPDGFALVTGQTRLDGGSGANVIVQASRLGAETGYIAQVGDDDIGMRITKSLGSEGVDTSRFVKKENGVSVYTYIAVDSVGQKQIFLNMGDAFLQLQTDQVDYSYIETADVFYTDLLPFGPAALGLKRAKSAGAKTVVNIQVGLPIMEEFGVSPEQIMDILPFVDVFAPCREAFAQLAKKDCPEKAITEFSLAYPTSKVVLTLGSKGSITVLDGKVLTVPAYDVEVVDTTGAGDSYLGAFMVGYYLEGMSIGEAMKFASAAAAFTCTKLGARSSPTRDQVDRLVKNGLLE
jgi:sugar/nucleoside kinase (ribokinase family)